MVQDPVWSSDCSDPKGSSMQTVQVAIGDASYAKALGEALLQDWAFRGWEVLCVETPDPQKKGVIVLDSDALDRLPSPVPNPERVVLIARNDPQCLARAWNAGIISVVYDNDSLSTAMLAIMAARFRISKSPPQANGARVTLK